MSSRVLAGLVSVHQEVHLTKRSAHLLRDGVVPERFLTDPRHVYVLEIAAAISRIDAALSYCLSLRNQVQVPPPHSWLNKIEITQERFSLQGFNIFTTILYSVFDQVLLLINSMSLTPIPERKVNYKKIAKIIPQQQIELQKQLLNFFDHTSEISKTRHTFIHQGKSRNAGRFDSTYRLKLIMKKFGISGDGVRLFEEEARTELSATMTNELELVGNYSQAIEDLLVFNYQEKLDRLGGLDSPNEKEIEMASNALDYLHGRTKSAYFTES